MDRELGLASYHDQRREVADVVKELTIIHAARLLLAYEAYKIYETVNVTTPVVFDKARLVLTQPCFHFTSVMPASLDIILYETGDIYQCFNNN